ncbi:MAG: hypothetical protein BEN19_08400, partial [Epulopiscium sp. Nuni2H_MBin003]
CIFLTNGSTAGILSAILTVCKPKDKLIVARNCHASVWNALVFADVIPIYVTPKYSNNMFLQVDEKEIQNILIKYPDVCGAIVVSPTYEGIVSNIRKIKEVLKDKILIVDEAHGAHFNISAAFPKSSVHCGADLVIHSMHKTLPTISQSALIHICSTKIAYRNLVDSIQMVQTSSPSYIMMGLMDYIRAYLQNNKRKIHLNYVKPLCDLRRDLGKLTKLSLFSYYNYDISKIVIMTNNYLTGYGLAQILREDYNIEVEASFESYIIIMTSVADNKRNLQKLLNSLLQIDSKLSTKKAYTVNSDKIPNFINSYMSVRDIKYKEHILIDINNSIGYICAKNIVIYPPGIPIVCIGEIITKKIITLICNNQNRIMGIVKNKKLYILVVKGGYHG